MTGHREPRPDLFTRTVDGQPVSFVRPADTDGPVWYAYEDGEPLGAVHVDTDDGVTTWIVELLSARHQDLDDAVRALRRRDGWF